mmetsp:Transcript_41155/g.30266  ORF Transcript_41155/g.30266 Transcript_41155/m.30266 type:complete len:119 (+) Transcript_41155:320-676(+)
METKKSKIEKQLREDIERDYMQKRLAPRVNQSGAIVDNRKKLEVRKQMSILNARQKMREQEQSYEFQKAIMDVNVANRPLLVETVSKKFINNLNTIKELEHHVSNLRNAGYNPDEYLT